VVNNNVVANPTAGLAPEQMGAIIAAAGCNAVPMARRCHRQQTDEEIHVHQVFRRVLVVFARPARTALPVCLLSASALLAACGGGGGGGSGGSGAILPIVVAPPASGGGSGTGNDPGTGSGYPHASEPIGTVRQIYDGALSPDLAVNTYRNIDRLFPTRTIEPGGTPYALATAATQLTQLNFTVGTATYKLADFMSTNRVAGLLVLKDGKIANETYQYGNTQKTRWMSMSVAKSITSTLIGAAVKDGYIASIDDPVVKYVPRLAGSAYDGATVRHVMMMASGAKWNETYTDPNSDRRQLLEAQISQKPGSAMDLMSKLPRAATPGAVYNYSTGETQVAGEIVRNAVKKPLAQYLSEKIWSKFGMEAQANWWLDSPDGVEIGGSGISATLRDAARLWPLRHVHHERRRRGRATGAARGLGDGSGHSQGAEHRHEDQLWLPLVDTAERAISHGRCLLRDRNHGPADLHQPQGKGRDRDLGRADGPDGRWRVSRAAILRCGGVGAQVADACGQGAQGALRVAAQSESTSTASRSIFCSAGRLL